MSKVNIYYYAAECSLRGWYIGRAIALSKVYSKKYNFKIINHSDVFRGDYSNVSNNTPCIDEYAYTLEDYINKNIDTIVYEDARKWLIDLQIQHGVSLGKALAAERHRNMMSYEQFVIHAYLTWSFFSEIYESHHGEQIVFFSHFAEHFYDVILLYFARAHDVPLLQWNTIWSHDYINVRVNQLDGMPYLLNIPKVMRQKFSRGYFEANKALLENVITEDLYPQTGMATRLKTWENIPQICINLYHRIKIEIKRGRKLNRKLLANYLSIIRDPRFYLMRRAKHLLSESVSSLLGLFESDIDLSESFYFFPLHHHPETEILLVNSEYANQIEVIENIARGLPLGVKLYVKGHPSHVGGFSPLFYRRLNNIHNVKVLDPTLSSRKLIAQAVGTISIKGTVVLEAILMKKPVLMLGDTYYTRISSKLRCTGVVDLWERIQKNDFYVANDEEVESFLVLMAQAMVPGKIDRIPANQTSNEVNEDYERWAADSFTMLDKILDIEVDSRGHT